MKKWIRLKYTKWYNILKDGISTNNPIVISVLGICSALAITNKVSNALAMGIGVTFVIIASSAVISLLRNVIPSKVRMIAYMVIISVFVIAVDMFLQGFFPTIAKSLGAYVGLIITNCIVMGRAEAFAVKNPLKYTLVDGFASGLGYTIVLLLVASVREILAFGTWFNLPVMSQGFTTWTIMAMAPGGFFVLGLFVWIIRELTKYYEEAV
ncbi:MAG: electron transport complex subunit RsxE [Acholeplasmatales bacterium]|jgi:Na+-transporting NADH:ubiquinone oxidoreductase subunit D|nr:electron transport complex subunit RsxE [Acholeplasmataceae bacterium]MDY0115613.1 electron transport complex subunit RsxE [Acholeplasmatales bacterium]MCK9233606.1 electron transport complex subunit RsxE [Acholeplasmataceae bacterium]MCK9289455.1 electron transport complex subunit RsxE [Acholeplasmataceae bacterium]MCK9427931.1 electron transport complex subunit RsxE [Acholeplasmataceae bacterium]